jgi:hypothetical protein
LEQSLNANYQYFLVLGDTDDDTALKLPAEVTSSGKHFCFKTRWQPTIGLGQEFYFAKLVEDDTGKVLAHLDLGGFNIEDDQDEGWWEWSVDTDENIFDLEYVLIRREDERIPCSLVFKYDHDKGKMMLG